MTLHIDEATNLGLTKTARSPVSPNLTRDRVPQGADFLCPESPGQSCLSVLRGRTLGLPQTLRGLRHRGAGVFSFGERKETNPFRSLEIECNEAGFAGLSEDGVGSFGRFLSGVLLSVLPPYMVMFPHHPPEKEKRGLSQMVPLSLGRRCPFEGK